MTGRRWPIRFGLRRTIWPTRDGWWCLGVALGLGVAAVNTGNNLVYLCCSMLLAVILVSGVLSEQSMRGLRLSPLLPEEIYAGRPAVYFDGPGGTQVPQSVIDASAADLRARLTRLWPLARKRKQAPEHGNQFAGVPRGELIPRRRAIQPSI